MRTIYAHYAHKIRATCAPKARNMRIKSAHHAHQKRAICAQKRAACAQKRAACAPKSRSMRTKIAQHAHQNRASCAPKSRSMRSKRAQLEKLEKLDFFFGGKNADFKLSGLVQGPVDALASALRGCYICTYERVEGRSNYG